MKIRILVLAAVGVAGLVTATTLIGSSQVSVPSCEQSVSEALLSNRIVGSNHSYRRDNPSEYALVRAYLDGGSRPSTAGMTHMGLHLVYLEDTCRAPDQTTTSTTTTAPTTTTTTTTTTQPPPVGANFYVAPTGSDTANGSQSSPWKTVKKACDTVTNGTINVAAGTYNETGTCALLNGVTLDGAGIDQTIIRSDAIDSQVLVQNTTIAQTVSDLTLDGQARSTANFGLKINNVRNLTVNRIKAQGFKNLTNYTGAAVNVNGATDFVLSNSTMLNSGGSGGSFCNGTLGLGGLLRANIFGNTVSTDAGYAVKATQGATITDSDIHDNVFAALTSSCSTWNTLTVELFDTTALNSQIRNNHFNGVLSLTDPSSSGPLGSGYRWRIHHNIFQLTLTNNFYGIEIDQNSTEVDHNWFDFRVKGLYAIANFTGQVKSGNKIHHNVFDGLNGPTHAMHITAGVNGWEFTKNTVVGRQSTWRDGYFSLGPGGSIAIRDNIFTSTVNIGDKLGIGLGGATIDHNVFWNLSSRGSNALNANPGMPLSGAFPDMYRPTISGYGALADGDFAVGPS